MHRTVSTTPPHTRCTGYWENTSLRTHGFRDSANRQRPTVRTGAPASAASSVRPPAFSGRGHAQYPPGPGVPLSPPPTTPYPFVVLQMPIPRFHYLVRKQLNRSRALLFRAFMGMSRWGKRTGEKRVLLAAGIWLRLEYFRFHSKAPSSTRRREDSSESLVGHGGAASHLLAAIRAQKTTR